MPAASPLLIAVDGRSGAGKTSLTLELAALLREHHSVTVFHLEDIYPGWDGLDGGIARYVQHVLGPLRAGQHATWAAWDWDRDADGEQRTTTTAEIVLLEGVGAAAALARPLLDAVIWIEADAQVRRRTAIERDGDTYAPFWRRWADQEDRWLAGDDPAAAADVVVQGHTDALTPQAVRRALAALPSCAVLLAPERADRRGLTVRCERVDAVPDTPTVFSELYGASTAAVWLDSSDAVGLMPAPDSRGRFSIMADSGGSFGQQAHHRGGVTEISAGAVTTRIREPFFRWLDDVWGRRAVRAPEDFPCEFALGWLGYLGYELKRETGGTDVRSGGAPTGPDLPGTLPDAALVFAGRAVVVDHAEGAVFLLTLSDGGSDPERDAWLIRARNAIGSASAVAAADPAGMAGVTSSSPPVLPVPQFTLRDSREEYLDKVRSAQAEITEGTTYEVCLTTALTARAERLDPLSVYLHLRQVSPAPFAHFLRFPSFAVASTSPERFLRLDGGGNLRAEPIKGTRGRSTDPVVDAALREDLRTSAKDHAENIMIVDLLRNDLSHHAVPGSVTVSRLCDIETYATVHQMVSTIDARLRPGRPHAAVIASAFPAGSMTGAPKISTMAILDRLEQAPRGPYAGAAGYFSLTGATDLAVVIRTLVLQDGMPDDGTRLTLGVGGAITADSDPAEEWDEVRIKARGVLSALGSRFPDTVLP
ncbi:aminodeoxychorismate synthase component I [Arthrobacter echini]|uniref:Aminodeoxychorismate synthase component I n=1 Tax=Arthrobacter echini TaxID=1529066 RepID=A0A4S5E9V0_9MICC|nr:chorismate-binding protein [Arthrobacter echini]THJ68485.1 aminodeoxychorismate synthase component I [Arthrobacter echini]